MKAPRYATITISLDTERFRQVRPEARERFETWHVDRLLSGEEVAESELQRMGLKVAVRDAVRNEII